MKILLIGFYDYPYNRSAYILENNKLERIDLTDDDYDIISYRYWNEDGKYEKLKKRLFPEFDMVIVCDDGAYEILFPMK